MTTKNIAMGVAGLVATVAMTVPAFAGLLGTGLSYNDGTTWEGSKTFSVPAAVGNLQGSVEYAVFTASNFSLLFPDYTPTPGELVYAYQVFNTGDVNISKAMVTLLSSAPADNVGDFTSNGMSGTLPSSMSIIPADVIWNFNNPLIPHPGYSSGLAFSSIRKPRNDFMVVVDGGASANVTGIAGPGAVPLPEPSALVLLVVGAGWLGLMAFRVREGR